jgi:hypothetical protein
VVNVTKGSKLIDFDEIIITDHRGFMFDINIKEYFNISASKRDRSESRRLNLTNRKHREQFKDTLEKYLKEMKLLEKTIEVCTGKVTQHEMNVLDQAITYVLTVARKSVEGIQRNVPCSDIK